MPRGGALDRLARRRAVASDLRGLSCGEIVLEEASEATRLGERGDLSVVLRVNDTRFFRAAVTGGALSVAESYLRGDWDCDDLTSFVPDVHPEQRVCRSTRAAGSPRVMGLLHRLFHRAAEPTASREAGATSARITIWETTFSGSGSMRLWRIHAGSSARLGRRCARHRSRSSTGSAASSSCARANVCWRSAAAGEALRSTPLRNTRLE